MADHDASPRYALANDDDESDMWGTCLDIKGLFAPFDDPDAEAERRMLELVGWSPAGSLQELPSVAGDLPHTFGNAWIHVLDYAGESIAQFWSPQMQALEWHPSQAKPGLIDAIVEVVFLFSPYPAAEAIWERWRHGRPSSKSLWTECEPEDREAWMSVVAGYSFNQLPKQPDDPPGRTYHLDGSNVVNEMSFYCALGEAINGPGGYFGWNLQALVDCLSGNFGATRPFTLIWHDFEVARTHLSLENKYMDPEKYEVTDQTILDAILEVFQENRVNVMPEGPRKDLTRSETPPWPGPSR
jgi:RNAse (barnase) inhibitor barstar